jgi:hypothetical protein
VAAQSDGSIIIMISMGIWGLSPLRHAPLDIDIDVVSVFVLVFPYNDVRSDNIGEQIAGDDIFSFMPNVHSFSLDIERCLQLLLKICNFLRMRFFHCFQACLSLNVF